MKVLLSLLLLIVFQNISFASGLSAIRKPGESYNEARYRQYFKKSLEFSYRQTSKSGYTSAERAKKSLVNLDTTTITDVGSFAELEKQFLYIRDSRFIKTDRPEFPRRITWLYPDDGCYARAELAKFELTKNNFQEPKKIFAFGNLEAISNNSPYGSVNWWYHVAITYRVAQDVYVFDPALEPSRPLKLSEWNEAVGGSESFVDYSVCSSNTYDPSSDCYNPAPMSYEDAVHAQKMFLDPEWWRVIELDRNPEEELGNNPPWLTH